MSDDDTTARTCGDTRGKSAARRSRDCYPRASPGIRLSGHLDGDGDTIYRHVCKLDAEGIIVKRRDRPYRSGRAPIG
jgi:hypothetical protein